MRARPLPHLISRRSATIIPRPNLQHFSEMEALELQFYDAADFITPAEESWSWNMWHPSPSSRCTCS